jgi:hypothetical protein
MAEEERVGRLVHLAKSPGELSAIQKYLKQYESVVVDTRGFIVIADYICSLNVRNIQNSNKKRILQNKLNKSLTPV